MSKEDNPSSGGGLLSKVVRFVRNPTVNWSELDSIQDDKESQYSKQMLKEMIERKRRNDFVRRREFDQLRKLRQRDALSGQRTADPAARPSFFQSSLTSPGERAVTIKKIDEIEAQMSMQWWKSKQAGDNPEGAAPVQAGDALADATTVPAHPNAYAPTAPLALQPTPPARTAPEPLFAGDIHRVVECREPANDRPGGHVSLGDKSAAGLASKDQDIEPAQMVRNKKHVAFEGRTPDRDVCPRRLAGKLKEKARPGRSQLQPSPQGVRREHQHQGSGYSRKTPPRPQMRLLSSCDRA